MGKLTKKKNSEKKVADQFVLGCRDTKAEERRAATTHSQRGTR